MSDSSGWRRRLVSQFAIASSYFCLCISFSASVDDNPGGVVAVQSAELWYAARRLDSLKRLIFRVSLLFGLRKWSLSLGISSRWDERSEAASLGRSILVRIFRRAKEVAIKLPLDSNCILSSDGGSPGKQISRLSSNCIL
ncbi:hypothetical protein ABKV19_013826 [Rosa sericea]